MIVHHPLSQYLPRDPRVSALVYAAVVILLFLTAIFALADIAERFKALNESTEILARLQQHAPDSGSEPGRAANAGPAGSSFLEGPTVTVASAMLLRRIGGAVTRAGGTVVSSEVEPQSVQSKDGYVRAIANCEIEQQGLQKLLYDLEAGKPFLFIDQLVVQAQAPSNEGERMRVLLGVSGMWRAQQ